MVSESVEIGTKNILIYGASRGIGKEMALEYARRGCKMLLASRNTADLKKVAESVNLAGGEAHFIECDVSDKESVANAVDYFCKKMGRLDMAIYNSGVSIQSWFAEFDSGILEKTFAINVFGMGYALESCLRVFKRQGLGVFAGVGSLADARGFVGSGVYCASKAAVSHLLEAARAEFHNSPIRIITIKPGFVRTEMTAKNKFFMPFLMDADEAAQIIISGIDKGKSVIGFPMPTMLFSNFGKFVPSRLYDYLIGKWRKPLM